MSGSKVALYLRLSREDDDKKSESESITNQRDFLIQFTKAKNWPVIDIYIDDGYSGTSFDRPEFKRLLFDIEAGKIDTVITKDLSRLGRDYIQTGHYLERYFPKMGVRYIAVNDGIDTANDDNGNNDMSPFKSVINDMYAKDISKKVRTALTTKKKNGKFIGSNAPFGYKKNPNNRGQLIIDEEVAPIVRQIFKLFIAGNSLSGIAKILTKENAPTPSQVSGNSNTQKRFQGLWNDVMIKRILTTETYIGNLTQNRSRKINYKVDKKINLKQQEWIVVTNTHEPIVSKEDFLTVAKMISIRSYVPKTNSNMVHLLSGLIFCADCGAPMTFVKESATRTYLVCTAWRKYGDLKLCTSHCIREDAVENAIKENLKSLTQKVHMDKQIDHIIEKSMLKQKDTKQIDKINQKIKICKEACMNLYKDRVQGFISDEQFLEMQKSFIKEQKDLEELLNGINNRLKSQNNMQIQRERIMRFLDFEQLERHVLLKLVSSIIIHQDKKIDIVFTFGNPL